ncbi:MAG: DUF4214 domain-containing protein [Acidimicrobiales bacterium]|nr:DUF4214 domain-containing protein [Acidimicrobiales bacterium]
MRSFRGWAAAAVATVTLGAVAVAAPPVAGAPPAARPAQGAPAPGFDDPGIPVRPASERYVREVFLGALGRGVDEPSLAYWGERIDDGMARGTFAAHVVRSQESVRRRVVATWAAAGLTPGAGAVDADVAAARSGRLTIEALLLRLVSSQEFYETEGGDSPAGFVQALYDVVLDRVPDRAGADYWLARLQGGDSLRTIAKGFVYSADHLRAVVDDAHDRLLARAADDAERTDWAARMRRGEGVLHVDVALAAGEEAWTTGCSALDPNRCLLPFPNDVLTLPDATTDTGRRVVLKPSWLPANAAGAPFDPTEWNRQDGFSPGSAMLIHSAGIDPTESGLPHLSDIDASLDGDSPIVVVDTTDGSRWPFWAELDSNASDDSERALIIRPAVNFVEGHTYAVGIGDVVDAAGDPVEASAGFRVFRDNLPSADRRVEEERVRAEFAIDNVVSAGLDRDTLFAAWTFTVASTRNLAERIVHMRDEVLVSGVGGDTPFTVTSDEPRADGTRRIGGTYTVPSYLTGDGAPGSRLNLGDDWLPEQNGTITVPFVCTIPDTALTTPARAGLYGHGLLGTGGQANSGYVRDLAREHNMVFCGTDYLGMSDSDLGNTIGIIADLSRFAELPDRNQQGLLNFMVLGRLLTDPEGLSSDPAFQDGDGDPVVDGSDLVYYGLSQGGIMGGALVAVSPDITRGVLGVPGMNYSTLLERSVDFDPFFLIMAGSYPSALDRMMMISVIQMLWDRGEGNGYANHMTRDPLPGTPVHEVLLQVAFGDHQVAIAAADVQARTYGAATNDPPLADGRSGDVTPLWDIDRISSWPHDGSATIYWDSGTPAPPYENVPPRPPDYGEDPHSDPRADPDARDQISEFLKPGGVVVDVCDGAPCLVDFA